MIRLELRYPHPAATVKSLLRSWVLRDVFDEYAASRRRIAEKETDLARHAEVLADCREHNDNVARQLEHKRSHLFVAQVDYLIRCLELDKREADLIERSRAQHPANQPPATEPKE